MQAFHGYLDGSLTYVGLRTFPVLPFLDFGRFLSTGPIRRRLRQTIARGTQFSLPLCVPYNLHFFFFRGRQHPTLMAGYYGYFNSSFNSSRKGIHEVIDSSSLREHISRFRKTF